MPGDQRPRADVDGDRKAGIGRKGRKMGTTGMTAGGGDLDESFQPKLMTDEDQESQSGFNYSITKFKQFLREHCIVDCGVLYFNLD